MHALKSNFKLLFIRLNWYAKTVYREMSLRQNVLRQDVLTAKCPQGEISSRRNVLTAKCPYGEVSIGRSVLMAKFPTAKCPTAKCPTAKCPTAKCPTANSPVTSDNSQWLRHRGGAVGVAQSRVAPRCA